MPHPLVRSILRAITQPLVASRADRLARLLAAEIRPGDEVLDVGCGDLIVGQRVSELMEVRWTGVDVVEYHQTDLPFRRYDGRTLPFPSASFSTVLLSFVLHHCEDPVAVLRESMRVARSRLLIFEDVPNGRLRMALAKFHDFLANALTQEGIPLPYRFESLSGWRAILTSLDLDVTRVQPLRTQPLAFVKQALLVAAKKAVPADAPHMGLP